ncbi:cadherin-1-like [Mugil cephalus]|uniref:cadherin-1-like n=1 Tax=Mugil cephalus TaxID=48193 RepID=UPI001FB6C781|nr:cadherin-1-like [Mugil cephalus]
MATTWVAVWGIFLLQASHLVTAEEPCAPGFESDMLIFNVTRKHLWLGMNIGKVSFTDCTDRTRFLFRSYDSRFMVQPDGTLTVKRQVVLHEGHRDFFIQSWDSQGRKMTVPVRVLYDGHHVNYPQEVEHQHGDHTRHNHQHHLTETGSASNTEVPILYFPKSGEGLRRRKRDWVIPPISVSENAGGPYPLYVSQIRSSEDAKKKIFYSITGPGADETPIGLFTMDRISGVLYLTQPLDRETQTNYMLKAHAVAEGSGTAEDPMDIIVNVIDQNDNKPTFTQETFTGAVAEASPIGFEVLQALAIDLDEPNNANSDIRYIILDQEPKQPADNLFAINPLTGVIRVNAGGLDREKYPQYTLRIQAADMKGDGLIGLTKVILDVTDSNDNAPTFTQSSYEATVEENKVDTLVVKLSVEDKDEPNTPAWKAKFVIVSGDPQGFFTVKTGSEGHEGIITTAKGLDFERTSKYTLLVAVENEVPFATPLPTSTATVVVNVQDVNEAPVFDSTEKLVAKREDLAVDSEVIKPHKRRDSRLICVEGLWLESKDI